MKLIYTILSLLLLTSCVKNGIAPASSLPVKPTIEADTLREIVATPYTDTTSAYDWFNGTKGTSIIKVTCADCSALATIGNTTVPFIFNSQGVGQLKYTPTGGLSIYIAVCPGTSKAFKAEIYDAANNFLYAYSGVGGNWSDIYVIK